MKNKGGRPSETARGERNTKAKLTEEQVRKIREEYTDPQVTYAVLARRYGVTPVTIGRVINRVNWGHVD